MQFFLLFIFWVMGYFSPAHNETGNNKQAASAVKLVAFNARPEGNKNVLKWQTALEVNTREFIVEISADGKSFDLKAWISPKGTAQGPASYTYADASPSVKTFYRLRMVAADGKEQLSEVLSVSRTNK
jgi:hypothetical protein